LHGFFFGCNYWHRVDKIFRRKHVATQLFLFQSNIYIC
jgi:hypothetical protein